MQIETEVKKMQTRIQQLEAEEERALKVIQDAKEKALKLLTIKSDQIKLKQQLSNKRKEEFQQKMQKVKSRKMLVGGDIGGGEGVGTSLVTAR